MNLSEAAPSGPLRLLTFCASRLIVMGSEAKDRSTMQFNGGRQISSGSSVLTALAVWCCLALFLSLAFTVRTAAQTDNVDLSTAIETLNLDGRWIGGRLRQPQYFLEISGQSVSVSPLSNRSRSRSTPPVVDREQVQPSVFQIIAADGPVLTLRRSGDTESAPVHLLFWSEGSGYIWQAGDPELGYLYRAGRMPADLQGEWNCLEVSRNRPTTGRHRIVIGEDAYSMEVDGRIEVLHPIPLEDRGDRIELAVVSTRTRPFSVIVHRRSPELLLWETAEDGDPDRSSFLFLFKGEQPAWLASYLSNADVGSLQRRSAMRDEVTQNIGRIFDASVRYYNTGDSDAAGRPIQYRFPLPTPRTPGQVPCIATEPDPGLWGSDTWMALNFAIWDPFYFSYQYDSQGQGVGASFTVTAYGDFDCDGIYSTFTQTGTIREGQQVEGSELLILNPEE